MWFGIVTLFPEMFAPLELGITGRAQKNGLLKTNFFNPREFVFDKHHTVDDRPYGGGPGMVMMAQPLHDAVQAAKRAAPATPKVIYLSPQGKTFNQQMAMKAVDVKNFVLIAGRYEGIDERVISSCVDEEWSIGDFVLSGGELPAMTIIDATTRLLPGALGHEDSASQDTLSEGLLKYSQYTRPEEFSGMRIPEILLSGNHQAIARWRLKNALGRTWLKRPDLLTKKNLDENEMNLLMEFVEEYNSKN